MKSKITLISTDGYIQHGLRSISAFLKAKDFDVQVIFLDGFEHAEDIYRSKEILKSIRNIAEESVLVGISTNMQTNYFLSKWLSDNIKELRIPIVLGGIYPTLNPEDCIKDFDFICRGEGEYAILELAERLIRKQSIENVSNLWMRSEDKIIRNPPRDLIGNLDVLPFPDIDTSTHYYFDKTKGTIEKIPKDNPQMVNSEGIFCVHGSRGCPFICAYCSNKAIDTLYCGKFRISRKRNINLIIEELKRAVEQAHPKKIWFSDDVFTIRPVEELRLFRDLYKKHINLPFMCYVSPTTVSEDKIELLVDAGLKWIEMGIQSGSDYINKNIYERQQTREDVLKATQILHKFGDKVTLRYQFILFNEYEREEDIIETITLIKKIPPPYSMQVFTLSLFKGSELYNRYLKDGHVSTDYKLLTYADADIAFWRSINKISNRKHYLYMLLWFMIQSTVFGRKIFNPLRNDRLIKIKNVPTWFCYLSSAVVVMIYKIVLFKRWLIPLTWIK